MKSSQVVLCDYSDAMKNEQFQGVRLTFADAACLGVDTFLPQRGSKRIMQTSLDSVDSVETLAGAHHERRSTLYIIERFYAVRRG